MEQYVVQIVLGNQLSFGFQLLHQMLKEDIIGLIILFNGFIYNPYAEDTPVPPIPPITLFDNQWKFSKKIRIYI